MWLAKNNGKLPPPWPTHNMRICFFPIAALVKSYFEAARDVNPTETMLFKSVTIKKKQFGFKRIKTIVDAEK